MGQNFLNATFSYPTLLLIRRITHTEALENDGGEQGAYTYSCQLQTHSLKLTIMQ